MIRFMPNNKKPSPESEARKQKYGDRYGHKEGKKLVTFYVKDEVLSRWDTWCKERGQVRSQVLIQAMNHWIDEFTSKAKEEMDIEKLRGLLSEKMDELKEELAEAKIATKTEVFETDTMAKLYSAVKIAGKEGARSDDLAELLQKDEDFLVKALESNDSFKIIPKTGRWKIDVSKERPKVREVED